jgi:hypothetical protein
MLLTRHTAMTLTSCDGDTTRYVMIVRFFTGRPLAERRFGLLEITVK